MLKAGAIAEGRAQCAEEGPAPTALGEERALMGEIGVVMGGMKGRVGGSL